MSKRDEAMKLSDDLRAIAEGRMLMRVAHGVTVPAGLLVKAAETIERLAQQQHDRLASSGRRG